MLTEIESLVRAVDHERVVGEIGFVEVVEQPAHVVVDRCNAAQVVLDVALVEVAYTVGTLRLRPVEQVISWPIGGVPRPLLLFCHAVERGVPQVVVALVVR
jgi:hypothetical protein